MRKLKILILSVVTLFFVSACASTPAPVDNSAADARAKKRSDESHKEMERGFDPCAMNPRLAVCKE